MLRTASFGDALGTVASFDAVSGLGVIAGQDGRTFPFHCTAISDGSRTIDAGVGVTFSVAAGHRGRLEATRIDRL